MAAIVRDGVLGLSTDLPS